jgi:hypothetical protein
MQYNLKEKIEVTEEFLNEFIAKSWQETETLQQQIANIDTSTKLGIEVAKLLKNTCTTYYVLIGCLEALAENPKTSEIVVDESETLQNTNELEVSEEPITLENETEDAISLPIKAAADFEPFEYFVDFDEPSGDPLSDKDLYG